jgi:transposase
MAAERLAMRNVREALRLRFQCGIQGARRIAHSIGSGKTAVAQYLAAAQKAGLTSWDQIEKLDETQLEQLLCPAPVILRGPDGRFDVRQRNLPDWSHIHDELRRAGVTLMLLWSEYREENPDGYKYTQFCEYYARWKSKLSLVMRQAHRPGEKAFVDFCDGPVITNPRTGEVRSTQIFVGAMGASCYTFALATWSQDIADWTYCNRRFLEFLGGVPQILVPDNLKSGIQRTCRYDPTINPAFQEMSNHYGTCVIPARVRKPRDKAKAENAVLQAQRWILAVLRNRSFSSLQELNDAIAVLLVGLNGKVMRGYGKSRRELFDSLDRPALKALPATPYEWAEWKKVRLGIDYHVRFDDHFYSAPYQLVREDLWLRASAQTVELFFKGNRVTSHARSFIRFKKTTIAEHMPSHHRAYAEWTPERISSWVGKIGPNAKLVVEKMMSEARHPELAFNQARGLISLANQHGNERTEKACIKALSTGSPSYTTLKTMLKNRMEDVAVRKERANIASESETQLSLMANENLRGEGYYH